ncbi:MAG: hypothetical protein ACXVCP_11145 [Bdellovibrio sp.]
MTRLFLILIIVLASNLYAQAEQTYTTEHGYIFTKVADPSFGPTWQAPNGQVWSQYQGMYENYGKLGDSIVNEHNDHEVIDSVAVRACQSIGGKLPSLQEFQTFFNYFNSTADFHNIFPVLNNADSLFWTRTAPMAEFVRFVKGAPHLDPFGDVTRSTRRLSVICMHEPN